MSQNGSIKLAFIKCQHSVGESMATLAANCGVRQL